MHTVRLGAGEWLPGEFEHLGHPADVAAAGAWTDESTLVAKVAFLGTPFIRTLTLRATERGLAVALDQNVSFGDTHLGSATATAST